MEQRSNSNKNNGALVEWLRQTKLDREVPGAIPDRVVNFLCIFDGFSRIPHKKLGAEAYNYDMINAPVTYLTLNRFQSLMVGCENLFYCSAKSLQLNWTEITNIIFFHSGKIPLSCQCLFTIF